MKVLNRITTLLLSLVILTVCGATLTACKKSNKSSATLQEIYLEGYKTQFATGEEFSVGDLTILAQYSDGEVKEVDDYQIDSTQYNKDANGEYTIICYYTENGLTKSREYVVSVGVKSLKVLMIGNSFAVDTIWFVPEIAKNYMFEELEFGVLSVGGCSIQQHYEYSQTGKAVYEFLYYKDGAWIHKYDDELKSIEFGIKFKDWNIITMQTNSSQSGRIESYGAELTNLITYVKNTATNPDMKLVWNMPWAYTDSDLIHAHGYLDQIDMYNSVVNAVQLKIVPNSNFITVLPTGTAVQNARSSVLGDVVNRDELHLNVFGRYVAAMTMFCTLTGKPVDDIVYTPPGLDAEKIEISKESVKNAIKNKYAVTEFQK